MVYFELNVGIIGGGAQGLTLLEYFQSKGISSVILTKSIEDYPNSQSELNHGYMHQGYIFPAKGAIEPNLLEDWPETLLTNIKNQNQNQNYTYLVGPSSFLKNFTSLWDSNSIPYKQAETPAYFKNGSSIEEMNFIEIDDFTYNKTLLLDSLGEKHSDKIFYGDINSIQHSENYNEVEFSHNNETFHFRFNMLFLCSGSSNFNLVKQFIKPNEDVSGLQKCSNLHMLCIKGPKDIIPPNSVICWPKQLFIASHSIGDETLLYISIFNQEQNEAVKTDENEYPKNAVNNSIIQAAVQQFFSMYPLANENKEKLQWNCYSAWKNDHPSFPAHFIPFCKNVEPNVVIVNPNIVANIFRCAKLSMKLFSDMNFTAIEQPELPSTSYIKSNGNYLTWKTWEEFVKQSPCL